MIKWRGKSSTEYVKGITGNLKAELKRLKLKSGSFLIVKVSHPPIPEEKQLVSSLIDG